MPRVATNGIEIEYEEFGHADDPVLLLICGLGSQLLSWDVELCAMFVERGFRVVRFDNRDVGFSTSFAAASDHNLDAALAGEIDSPPYTLDDMADDTAGLLDGIGADVAHVVGLSMGGMIAQALAIRHPHKVLSLCSIMSTTGDPSVGLPTPAALDSLLQPPPATREEAMEGAVRSSAVIGSPGFPADESRLRARAARAWDRATDRTGAGRQVLAIITAQDRTEGLGRVEVPTLVIHGREDPLVNVSGGEATARAVPGAELLVIPGMGHELSVPLWPQLVDAIVDNTSKVAVR